MICLLLILSTAAVAVAQQSTPAAAFEDDRVQQLLNVRRIHIDKLSGTNAEQIRDMLMASLQSAKLFIMTENAERADAILRGTAEDLIFTDTFQYNESLNTRGGSGSGSGSRRTSGASIIGENESARISERKHEASTSLRLVNKDGDLLWSTTQESRGAKFRSAAADVADKVTRQLLADYERARKPRPVPVQGQK